MRPNYCLTVLHVFILATLFFTLDAESEDSGCSPEVKVHRHTVYEALLWEDLRINCTVTFCNNSPPTVSWYKLEKVFVPVNFNRSSHIKTEWKISNHLEGISFLIFQNIQRNHSGQYRCLTTGSVSHAINVSVDGNGELPNDTGKNESITTLNFNPTLLEYVWMYVYSAAGTVGFVIIVIIISAILMRGCKVNAELTTVTWTTLETESTTTQDALWPYVYRGAGVVVFVIIVITIYVASKCGCKVQGVHCARKSKNTPDPSPQPLPGGSLANQHVLPIIHINENDPNDPVYSNLLS